jgi:4a-hydroxytetrahydrobiopterin dehydratase
VPDLLLTQQGAEVYPLTGRALVFHGSDFIRAEAKRAVASGTFRAEPGGLLRLTITDVQLTVRLTRDMWQLEPRHIELARAVSAVAGQHGAVADRAAVQEMQLAVSAKPDAVDLGFWRAVLGYAPMGDDNGVDPLGHGSTVWMQELDTAKPLRHAMHVDVSVAREHAEARLAAALAAGGRIVDDSSAPASWILADRAGNKVCIAAWPDGSRTRG